MKSASNLGRREVRQMLCVVIAALLCFIGPTYLVAVMSRVIPNTLAVVLGFISFLLGVVLVLRLVKE